MHADTLSQQVRAALGLHDLTIRTEPQWGSTTAQGRQHIRQALARTTGHDLSDLATVPVLARAGLSISHHRARGGYALSYDTSYLGFDMELNVRVREDLLQRVVASDGERKRAPSAGALWTAKEAGFKCLKNLSQPRGLADLEIGNWIPLGKDAYGCEIMSTNFKTIGVVLESPIEGETWAFFRGFRFEEEGLRGCAGY